MSIDCSIAQTITVELAERSYPILIGQNLFSSAIFSRYIRGSQVCIVTNPTVAKYYLPRLKACLSSVPQVTEQHVVILPDGEQYKTLASFSEIIDSLVNYKHHRSTTLIALGGGVIGDLVGFAAACYQRGVNFIQIPTTLLSQVDASVGGKTAVNHPQGKNLIGAFHQPSLVLIDTLVLVSLPEREFKAGLAEVIKYGLTADAEFFSWLEQHIEKVLRRDHQMLSHLIARSCGIKADIVAEDECEKGRRAILNFGHTFGHAIESLTAYKRYLHGEAVAIGMLMACRLSCRLKYIDGVIVDRLTALLLCIGFELAPSFPGYSSENMLATMCLDKKNTSRQPTLILLKQLGQADIVKTVNAEQIISVLLQS